MCVGLTACTIVLQAVPPAWWLQRGVTIPNASANDYAAVNMGQLRHIAKQAVYEMNATLPGGAGPLLNEIVASWTPEAVVGTNYAAVNHGQLKTLARKFYDRLAEVGYSGPPLLTGQSYPWTADTADDDNYAIANIGQVKRIFSFAPGLVVLSNDEDGDGITNGYELANGLNPLVADGGGDIDSDGLSNLTEFQEGTAANNADRTAPTAPTLVTATTVSATRIRLDWSGASDTGNGVSGVAGYRVYRNGQLLAGPIITVGSFGDTGLVSDATYTYTIRTVDRAGNLSPHSVAVNGTTSAAFYARSEIFSYTGATQTLTIPTGVVSIRAKVWGAGGGAGYEHGSFVPRISGGAGGYSQMDWPVTTGDTITILVGAGGKTRGITTSFGGGGASLFWSGQGGGRSEVQGPGGVRIIAGGGGGGATSIVEADQSGRGGNGGGANQNGLAGENNRNFGSGSTAFGGAGGTLSSGGAGGAPGGGAGSSLQGQSAIEPDASFTHHGGAGGGGYFGGGAGSSWTQDGYRQGAGGGGGSGFASGGRNILGYQHNNSADADWSNFAGAPGLTGAGGHGRVVLLFGYESAPATPLINSAATVQFTKGVFSSYQIAATNSPTGFEVVGDPPPGMSVNSVAGQITGTPTQVGNYRFQLKAANAAGIGSRDLSISVVTTETQLPETRVVYNGWNNATLSVAAGQYDNATIKAWGAGGANVHHAITHDLQASGGKGGYSQMDVAFATDSNELVQIGFSEGTKVSLGDKVLIAGSGGSAGKINPWWFETLGGNGGNGGGANQNGFPGQSVSSGGGGGGGNYLEAGLGGGSNVVPFSTWPNGVGSSGTGGSGGTGGAYFPNYPLGGQGGSGHFGGGGGGVWQSGNYYAGAGGGGGSGYAVGGENIVGHANNNPTDPDWGNSAGESGQSGRVVLALRSFRPAITSPSSWIMTYGVGGSFTITTALNATGYFLESGTLPTGLQFDGRSGVISGTPTQTGTFPLTVRASNAVGLHAATPLTIYVSVAPQLPLVLSAAATQNYNATQQLSVTGGSGSGTVSYAIVAQAAAGAATLSGNTLTANTGTGWVDVRATKAGDSNFLAAMSNVVRVSFARSNQAALTLSATSAAVAYGDSVTLSASGGNGSGEITYSSAAGGVVSGNIFTATSSNGTVQLVATKAASADYLATTASLTLTLTQRPLTVTLGGGKIADGTTSPTGAQANVTSGALAIGDTIGFGYSNTSGASVGAYSGLVAATIRNATNNDVSQHYVISYAGSYVIVSPPPASNGLRAWYRADLGVTIDANNKVSAWQDVSGHGFHLAQADAARRPTYAPVGVGDQASVEFAGAQSLLSAAINLQDAGNDLTVVLVLNAAPTQFIGATVVDLDSAGQNGFSVAQPSSATNQFALAWRDPSFALQGQAAPLNNPAALQPQALVFVKEGTTQTAYLNGELQGTATVSSLMLSPTAVLGLGGSSVAAPLAGYSGKIAEVLVYNRALNATERGQIAEAAVNRYGMNDSDGDELLDKWEMENFGTLSYSKTSQLPGHSATVGEEYKGGANPGSADTDGDGLSDRKELDLGTNPTNLDTDNDGVTDGLEAALGSDPLQAGPVELAFLPVVLPVPAGTTQAGALDISNTGVLAGYAGNFAARWSPGASATETVLGLGPPGSYAQAVNDAGTAVGDMSSDTSGNKAMIWLAGSSATQIAGSQRTQFAWDINRYGVVVGHDTTTGAFRRLANGDLKSLTAPTGYASPEPYTVNDSGLTVGRVIANGSGAFRAAIWPDGVTAATLLPAPAVEAFGLNSSGTIVGRTGTGAFVYRSQAVEALPAPASGATTSDYHQINSSNLILADSGIGPILWQPDGQGGWLAPRRLAELLITDLSAADFMAWGLNDKGELAGEYSDPATGKTLPVRFQPTLRPRLLVDLDRDGVLRRDSTDTATAATPFRFWVNDDDDAGDMGGSDIPQGAGLGNGQSPHVSGRRDLVDFFPVFLDVKSLLRAFPTSQGYAHKLKHADGSLRCVYTNLRLGKAFDYLRPPSSQPLPTSGYGSVDPVNPFSLPPESAVALPLTAQGFPLTEEFLNYIMTNDGGVILVEGTAPTSKPLVYFVEKADGTVIAEVKLELRIVPVETMFRHVDLTSAAKNYDGSSATLPQTPTAFPAPANEPASYPDSLTNGKYFVFVHGYNVDAQKARGWHAEIYKRMHVLGSKARFVGVTWHGATGKDYHKAVYQAFQTGDALKAALTFTGSADVTIAAHSLGNMVVSHAIQSDGYSPSRYYMINAAVPIEAYDLSNVDAAQRTAMIENDWKSRDARFFASNWHQLFSATPADRRNELSWKNRLVRARRDVDTHNFYSPGEDVVENATTDSAAVAVQIWNQGTEFFSGKGAWTAQEMVKGVNWTTSVADLFLERGQAGWDSDLAYLFTSHASITNEQLKTRPFFDEFIEADLINADPEIASNKASEAKVQYDLLARGLPALSYAAAANRIIALDQIDPARNFDMETKGRTSGQWPTEGHSGSNAGKWLHSDFKNAALPYVYQMYEAMIAKGSLK